MRNPTSQTITASHFWPFFLCCECNLQLSTPLPIHSSAEFVQLRYILLLFQYQQLLPSSTDSAWWGLHNRHRSGPDHQLEFKWYYAVYSPAVYSHICYSAPRLVPLQDCRKERTLRFSLLVSQNCPARACFSHCPQLSIELLSPYPVSSSLTLLSICWLSFLPNWVYLSLSLRIQRNFRFYQDE